jgi:hypothetical protein
MVFELFNEPYYMNSTRLNEMNAALVPAIRKNSPTRQLHLGGLAHMKSSWLMSASQRTPLDLPEPPPTAYRNRPLQAANPDVIIFPPARPAHGVDDHGNARWGCVLRSGMASHNKERNCVPTHGPWPMHGSSTPESAAARDLQDRGSCHGVSLLYPTESQSTHLLRTHSQVTLDRHISST